MTTETATKMTKEMAKEIRQRYSERDGEKDGSRESKGAKSDGLKWLVFSVILASCGGKMPRHFAQNHWHMQDAKVRWQQEKNTIQCTTTGIECTMHMHMQRACRKKEINLHN